MKVSNLLPILLFLPVLVGVEMAAIQPGHTVPNGCGGEGDWRSKAVPNNPTGASFKAACNNHDTCYETPGRPKEYCDTKFYNEMVSACSSKYDTGVRFYTCKKVAGGYHWYVNRYGAPFYNKAQGR